MITMMVKMMNPMSAEAAVVRNYIDWIISLPWDELTEENVGLERAAEILDEDHYGLEKIKERIGRIPRRQHSRKPRRIPVRRSRV